MQNKMEQRLRITFFGYNTFIIESGNKKIAIDPGAMFFYYFRLTSLIPKSEWQGITHILITHGDPDHYWHADRVAEASNADVICNKTMVQDINGETRVLGPRSKGLGFTKTLKKPHTILVDETLQINGVSITGLKATHGPLGLKFGPFRKILKPGPEERVGWGAIGFKIEIDGKTIINLGDTLLHTEEWEGIKNPDVLMIPIGGKTIHNTMDQEEAVEVVEMMAPHLVIPCHYNCPVFFTKNYNPADENRFKEDVEKTGAACILLKRKDFTFI